MEKLTERGIENRWLWLLGIGWLLIVGMGLFVPLMDNDSAHHANIALRMFLTGDYVRLVDYDGPYLDKPHLHFWLAAFSYHLFGVNGFAYKFPTFLFSLIGIWSVYRSSVMLLNESAGRIAPLIYATSVAFLLGLNDVRMDGILSAGVAIAVWQLVGFLKSRSVKYILGAALGMAIGFCTKGHIGVFVPILFLFTYVLIYKEWRVLLDVRLLWGILLFFLLIAPVVYCYYLQFNLHPEVVVRGKNQIDGVRFILWDQTVGRYSGEMGSDSKGDRLFFIHTFLWVFAPWSLVAIFSLLINGGGGKFRPVSKIILLVLLVFGGLIGFSSFKLPHYLNVILPIAAIWAAEVFLDRWDKIKRIVVGVGWLLWLVVGLFTQFLLIWWFPNQSVWFWFGFGLFLYLLFYIHKSNVGATVGGYVVRLAASMLLFFWLLNVGFYPSLLKYQGGNVLAEKHKKTKQDEPVYSLVGCYSSSFYFYSGKIRKEISPTDLKKGTGVLLLDEKQLPELARAGVKWKKLLSASDYEITRLTSKFLNPESRDAVCTQLLLVEF